MASAMQIWLSVEGEKDRLRLPVLPPSLEVNFGMEHQDLAVAQLGQITLLGDRRLRDMTISSFFPAEYNPNYCEYKDIPNPYPTINKLVRWADSDKPIRLVVTGTNINELFTIREITQVENGGEPDDVYYTLVLKEYRNYNIRIKEKTEKEKVDEKKHPSELLNPNGGFKIHTLRSGDTLSGIAYMYSNCSLDDIYRLNPDVKGRERRLQIGEKIKIPANAIQVNKPRYIPKSRPSYSGGNGSSGSSSKSGSWEKNGMPKIIWIEGNYPSSPISASPYNQGKPPYKPKPKTNKYLEYVRERTAKPTMPKEFSKYFNWYSE